MMALFFYELDKYQCQYYSTETVKDIVKSHSEIIFYSFNGSLGFLSEKDLSNLVIIRAQFLNKFRLYRFLKVSSIIKNTERRLMTVVHKVDFNFGNNWIGSITSEEKPTLDTIHLNANYTKIITMSNLYKLIGNSIHKYSEPDNRFEKI